MAERDLRIKCHFGQEKKVKQWVPVHEHSLLIYMHSESISETGALWQGTFIALSAMKRSKGSGDKDSKQSVTPYIHPCHIGLNSKIYATDQRYIT